MIPGSAGKKKKNGKELHFDLTFNGYATYA
jgi:hypothetical protein